MEDAALNMSDFQRLIKVLMKEKYTYEENLAQNVLNRRRRQSECRFSGPQVLERPCSSGSTHSESLLRSTRANEKTFTQGGSTYLVNTISNKNKNNNEVCERRLESFCNSLPSNFSVRDADLVADEADGFLRERGEKDYRPFVPLSPKEETVTQRLLSGNSDDCALMQNDGMQIQGVFTKLNDDTNTTPTKAESLRLAALEARLDKTQELLSRLADSVSLLLAGKKGDSVGIARNNGAISELPDNPNELGRTAEEKILTVLVALAKRVRSLEVDLEASLQQLRVMEAAAIERDMKLNATKVSREETEDIVAKIVMQLRR